MVGLTRPWGDILKVGVLGALQELHGLPLAGRRRLAGRQHLLELTAVGRVGGAPRHAHLHERVIGPWNAKRAGFQPVSGRVDISNSGPRVVRRAGQGKTLASAGRNLALAALASQSVLRVSRLINSSPEHLTISHWWSQVKQAAHGRME